MKIRIINRDGKTFIEVEGGEVKMEKREGKCNGNPENLPAISSRQALPASLSNEAKQPEIVNDPAFDLDEAVREIMRGEEPEGFWDWLVHALFSKAETKLERIQRHTNELEALYQLKEQIIKQAAQKYRMNEAFIEAKYAPVLKWLECKAKAQGFKALESQYAADEGKSKRALKREEKVDALTEGANGQDYGIESFFEHIEEDALNYMKSSK